MGNTLCVEQTVAVGASGARLSKIERYGWIVRDEPGVFMEIDKADLNIDHEYQRVQVNVEKVRALARDWSWAGCGSISVALRPNGRFFVFDGQHRVLAAKTRSDITALPCMVFECDCVAKEAAGFLVTNSERKPVTAIDKFRSLVITEDEAAGRVESLLRELGLEISKTANRAGQIKCIARCLLLATSNWDFFKKSLVLTDRLCRDVAPIHEDILAGLYHVHRKHGLLDDPRFVRRVIDVGHAAIVDGIKRSRNYFQKGGEKTLRDGILAAVNKGLRHRFGETQDSQDSV